MVLVVMYIGSTPVASILVCEGQPFLFSSLRIARLELLETIALFQCYTVAGQTNGRLIAIEYRCRSYKI